jgi:F0F1-type ATP synthase assembly protein I
MENPKGRNDGNFKQFMGLGFELLASVLLGAFLGKYLDEKMSNEQPYMTILGILLFLSASFYHLIVTVSRMK